MGRGLTHLSRRLTVFINHCSFEVKKWRKPLVANVVISHLIVLLVCLLKGLSLLCVHEEIVSHPTVVPPR